MGKIKRMGKYVLVFVAGGVLTYTLGLFSPPVWDQEAARRITLIQDPVDDDQMWFDVTDPNLSGVRVKIRTGPTDQDFQSLRLEALSEKPDVAVAMHYQHDDEKWGDMFTYYVHYRRDGVDRVNVWNDFDVDGQFDIRMIVIRGAGELQIMANIGDQWIRGTLDGQVFKGFSSEDGTRYRFEDGKGWVRE